MVYLDQVLKETKLDDTRKSRLGKDECAFCHEEGHWKKDCLKLKKKER